MTGHVCALMYACMHCIEEDIITEGLEETEVDDTTDVPITPASTLTSQITKKDVTTTSSYSAITELPGVASVSVCHS